VAVKPEQMNKQDFVVLIDKITARIHACLLKGSVMLANCS